MKKEGGPWMASESPFQQVINVADSEHFLETLIGPTWATTPLVWQTFDDNNTRKHQSDQTARTLGHARKDPYAKVLEGTWAHHKTTLTTLNRNGAGVFLTVNETKGGRKVEHLQAIRAVWCEWDTPEPLPEWPLAPHIIVESSPQKFHIYWLTDDMTPPDHHRVMMALIGTWGSDPNAGDVTRVLRVPGFYHRKVDARKGLTGVPWCVKLQVAESRDALPPYASAEILDAFGVPAWEAAQARISPSPRPTKTRTQTTPINVVELREALARLSSDTRQTWLRIGMALASTGHPGAFALWDEWSKSSQKYDEEDQYRTWQSFRDHQPTSEETPRVTLGTLYKMAKEAGWDRSADWSRGLITNQQGYPVACPANIMLLVRHTPVWKEGLRWNRFANVVEYGTPILDEYGRVQACHRWSDTDDAALADYLRAEHHMSVTNLAHCTQAIEAVAHDDAYDPITSWLDDLPVWDEIDRLPSFFEDFCGAERSPYAAFCGVSLFLGLVSRAYTPGCQWDTVPVLEGPEGARKTSLCRLLGGPWYKGITLSFESKDLFTSLRSTWLGELAELDSFARSGQARIRAIITTLSDAYRPAYGRNEVEQRRRSVFVGTTNEPAYLVDPHGARRFYPLRTPLVNLEGVAAILPQLFAEAKARYERGEGGWEESAEVARWAADAREQVHELDPWEIDIADWGAKHEEVMMSDLLGSLCLNIPVERRTRSAVTRIGTILSRQGYLKTRRRNPLDWGKLEYVYIKKSGNT